MDKTNILYLESSERRDIIIETDAEGHNNIARHRDFKYNRLVNKNASFSLRTNIVVINNIDIPNTVIEADNIGHNTVKSFDEYAKEEMDANAGNIFKDLLMKTRQKKSLHTNLIDVYLTEKRESLQEKLRRATDFHKKKQFNKANELYENALDSIKYDSYPDEFMLDDCDILGIKFALALSKLGINKYSSLQSAEEILISLIGKHGTKFPSLYYYLAKVYYNLNNFKKARKTLEDGLKVLEKLDYLIVITWPGTKDNMVERLNKDILEQNMVSLLDQSKIYHLPDARCKFVNCQIENTSIFFKSPDFVGYVNVKCTNKCNIAYHRSCWKKKLKMDGVKKLNTLLDLLCVTDDCYGLVYEIIIYDEKFKILSSICSPNKDLKNVKNECKLRQPHIDKMLKTSQTEKKDQIAKKNATKLETKFPEKDRNISKSFEKHDITSVIQTYFDKEIKASTYMFQPKTYTLNSNAKEYIPPKSSNISINSAEQSNVKQEIIKYSNFNTNAKEYVPMLDEQVYFSEQSTQCSENVVNQSEYDSLQCEISILQAELFNSEESYNNLLAEYENFKTSNDRIKLTSDIWTETETSACDSCVKYQGKLEEKILAVTDVTILDNGFEDYGISSYVINSRSQCMYFPVNEQLENKIKVLEHELKELKNARLFDREVFARHEQKFLQSNKVLVTKIQDLMTEKESILNEYEDYKKLTENENLLALKKILLEQITYCRNFYLGYVTMFENKCKHMIWELEDIKTLTTTETLPSIHEVDENLLMWRQALRTATENHTIFMIYFDRLFERFTIDPIHDLCSAPIPIIIHEPPSVIHRHFKSFFLVNKRLEQDLNRQIANYYKMLSMPYPGVFPYNMAQSPPLALHPVHSECDSQAGAGATQQEMKMINPPPGLGGAPVALAQEQVLMTVQETQTQNEETNNPNLDCSNLSETQNEETNNPNLDCSNLSETQSQDIPKDTVPDTTKEQQSTELGLESAEAASLPQTTAEPESKGVVVGSGGLMFRLQQRYPLTPPKILQDAVQLLRDARGGLTGLDSKTLFGELRIIIVDLLKKERHKPGYQKINEPIKEKPNAWAPINNAVTWHNNNPQGNCAICFEKMSINNSTQLRCQHDFHTTCIKTWLQNNSICPICRSYTTLDDEFPPLKSK